MYSFLAQPNALTHLDLSSTECALDMVMASIAGAVPRASHRHSPRGGPGPETPALVPQVCAALLRGCLQYLAVLNLSRTVFSHR